MLRISTVVQLALAGAVLGSGSPALAGNPYVGVELGAVIARANDVDETVGYLIEPSGTQVESELYDDVFALHYDHGVDLDFVAGYDLGWVRIEGELAHKRVGLKRNDNDDITDEFLDDLNTNLARDGGPGHAPLTIENFQPDGSLKVNSAMLNALIDVRVAKRFNVYGGGGMGRAFAKGFNDKDTGKPAWQYMAGVRYDLTDRVELGFKYRYFNSGVLLLEDDRVTYAGNPVEVSDGEGTITQTTTALVDPRMKGKFRSRNLLLSLTYNFR